MKFAIIIVIVFVLLISVPVLAQEVDLQNQFNTKEHNEIIDDLQILKNNSTDLQGNILEINNEIQELKSQISKIDTNTDTIVTEINKLHGGQEVLNISVNDHTLDEFSIYLTIIAIGFAGFIAYRQYGQGTKIEDALYDIQVFKDKKYNYAVDVLDMLCYDFPVLVKQINNVQIQLTNSAIVAPLRTVLDEQIVSNASWLERDQNQLCFILSSHADVLLSVQIDRATVLSDLISEIHKNIMNDHKWKINSKVLMDQINKLQMTLTKKEITPKLKSKLFARFKRFLFSRNS